MVASAATCSNKLHWVYVFRDPRDNSIRYIGVSTNPKARRQIHEAYAKNYGLYSYQITWDWIRELWSAGLSPIQQVVSDALSLEAAYQFEKDLICLFCRSGIKLSQHQLIPMDCMKHTDCVGERLKLNVIKLDGKSVGKKRFADLSKLVFSNVAPGIWKSSFNGREVVGEVKFDIERFNRVLKRRKFQCS